MAKRLTQAELMEEIAIKARKPMNRTAASVTSGGKDSIDEPLENPPVKSMRAMRKELYIQRRRERQQERNRNNESPFRELATMPPRIGKYKAVTNLFQLNKPVSDKLRQEVEAREQRIQKKLAKNLAKS